MEFVVEKPNRLDKFLADRVKALSRTQLQRFIRRGLVKVNGVPVIKPGFALRAKDTILVIEEKIISTNEPFHIEPEEMPLEIVYEDKDIVVINKPAGLLVHPTLSQKNHTLVNALVEKYPEILNVGENVLRPGIVHRLDKDTSGLLIVAKTQTAFQALKKQFLNHEVEKKYLALVRGVPKEKEGVIDFIIRPSKKMRFKKVAMKKIPNITKRSHRAAKTFYKVERVFGDKFSLLNVSPQTGRTHQIRVHLSAIGHPVIGDKLYGTGEKFLERQFLHAYYLKFTLPSGKAISLEADLPEDLRKVLSGLTADN